MIEMRFFQAAATAIPTLMIAAGFASAMLDPAARRRRYEAERLRSKPVILAVGVGTAFVVSAEVVALVTIATDRPTPVAFALVLGAVLVLLSTLASMAVYRIVEPLAPTRWAGVEVPLFALVLIVSAAVSWSLLSR